MTARPLPEAVERRLQAALLDAYNHGWAVGARVKAPVGPDNHEAALRAAIAAAMAPGEPVAESVRDALAKVDVEVTDRRDDGTPVYTVLGLKEVEAAHRAEVEAAVKAERALCERLLERRISDCDFLASNAASGSNFAVRDEWEAKAAELRSALCAIRARGDGRPDSGQGGVGSE